MKSKRARSSLGPHSCDRMKALAQWKKHSLTVTRSRAMRARRAPSVAEEFGIGGQLGGAIDAQSLAGAGQHEHHSDARLA